MHVNLLFFVLVAVISGVIRPPRQDDDFSGAAEKSVLNCEARTAGLERLTGPVL